MSTSVLKGAIKAICGYNMLNIMYIKSFLDVLGRKYGAGGRTRTDTLLPKRDFESRASTNFATPAGLCEAQSIYLHARLRQYFS